jgi:glutamate racemase
MIPDDISLIDTGAAVARQLQRLLAERNLLAEEPNQAGQILDQCRATVFRKRPAPAGPGSWRRAKIQLVKKV